MIRFYSPDIAREPILPPEDSAHCCRVLRMRAGDRVEVVDGSGNCYECEILDPSPKATALKIIAVKHEPRHWQHDIVIAVAPTKNFDRMEWLAEKAVELGVSEIVFVECERSVRKTIKHDRIRRVMVSAMKQSLKSRLPAFREMTIAEFVNSCSSSYKYVGYCSESVERRRFETEYDGKGDVAILIGPEGDFSPGEVDVCLNGGFVPVTFGNTRLRTETAAMYSICACHAIQTICSCNDL